MTQTVNMHEMLDKLLILNSRILQMKNEILDNQNLNHSAVNLISIIGDEKMSLKQITEISELDKSTVSRQINTLVREELVVRTTGKDKRFTFFELSNHAKIVYQKYISDFVLFLEDLLKGWSEEEKQMFSVLIGRANYSFKAKLADKELE